MKSGFTIPAYLEANTKDELRELMMRLQLRLKLKIHFYDFQKEGKKWVCWYEIPHIYELEDRRNAEAVE